MKKIGLLPRLILGLIFGIIVGKLGIEPLIRTLATFNNIFGSFLSFIIPMIILGFVTAGIADLGKSAGKLLAATTIIAYLSTIVSGTFAFLVNNIVFRKVLHLDTIQGMEVADNAREALAGYMKLDMPPIMGVMSALLLAFTVGIGIAVTEGITLKKAAIEFQHIIEKVISNIIIPFLPLHIAGIFANMTYEGKTATIMTIFSKVFLVVILLHLIIIVLQYTIAGALSGANPFKLMRNMVPAYLTAIGTQSSAATIPVTLEQTKKNGVSEGIADFVIPLCATIHLSGSTITLVSCSMAVMMINGMSFTLSSMIGFIMMLGVTMVAAPGVPGGAVMAALGLLTTMLGFNEGLISIMIALYLTQDSFGTACNISGDGAIAIVVNKIAGYKLTPRK